MHQCPPFLSQNVGFTINGKDRARFEYLVPWVPGRKYKISDLPTPLVVRAYCDHKDDTDPWWFLIHLGNDEIVCIGDKLEVTAPRFGRPSKMDSYTWERASEVQVAQVQEQLVDWRRWFAFGDRTGKCNLPDLKPRLQPVYVAYSGGVTNWDPEAYAVAAHRAEPLAMELMCKMTEEAERYPDWVETLTYLRTKGGDSSTDWRGQAAQALFWSTALSKVPGSNVSPIYSALSQTKLNWLKIELALRLGWDYKLEANRREHFVDGTSVADFEAHIKH